MRSRFEIVADEHDRFVFQFLSTDGSTLLRGLPSRDRYAVQVELMETRTALRVGHRFTKHTDDDGGWFAVITKKNGDPLARTTVMRSEAELNGLIELLTETATGAPLLKHQGA